MASSGGGQHRIWGAIEVSSASSSSSNSVADDRPAYSASQMKEHLKYLRDRKPGGQDSWTPMLEHPPRQLLQQQSPAHAVGSTHLGSHQVAPRHGDGTSAGQSQGTTPSKAPQLGPANFLVFSDKRGTGIASSTNDSDCWDVDGELSGMTTEAKDHNWMPSSASVDGSSAALAAPGREGGMSSLPSAGSAAHVVGTCRPCHYVHTKVGCEKGVNCGFCHYKHPKRRRPRPTKVERGRDDGEEGGYSSDEGGGAHFPGHEYAPAPANTTTLRGSPNSAAAARHGMQPEPPGPPPPYGSGARLGQNHMLVSL